MYICIYIYVYIYVYIYIRVSIYLNSMHTIGWDRSSTRRSLFGARVCTAALELAVFVPKSG